MTAAAWFLFGFAAALIVKEWLPADIEYKNTIGKIKLKNSDANDVEAFSGEPLNNVTPKRPGLLKRIFKKRQ